MAIGKGDAFSLKRKVALYLLALSLSVVNCLPTSLNKGLVPHKCASLEDTSLNNLDTCYNNPYIINVCDKLKKAIYFANPPYSDIRNVDVLGIIIYSCCGFCVSENLTTNTIPHLTSETKKIILFLKSSPNSADIAFPVTGQWSMTMKFGYYFIPVMRKPILMYVTPLDISAFERAVASGANLYALILVCVLMSIIFGFIYWVIESKIVEKDETPLKWASAIWWSMVTLFSQGLEENPKSFPMRILSILWLLVAVIMMALITSILTASMVAPVPTPTMMGKRVGTLSNRFYNNHTIKKHGGKIVVFPTPVVEMELYVLMQHLKNKTIDGLLIDKYSLSYSMLYIQGLGNMNKSYLTGEIGAVLNFFRAEIVRTEVENDDDLYYGLLVKDEEVYSYLREAVIAHWLQFNDWFLGYVVKADKSEEARIKRVKRLIGRPMFSMDDLYMQKGLIYLSAIVAVLVVVLWLYESRRKICYSSSNNIIQVNSR